MKCTMSTRAAILGIAGLASFLAVAIAQGQGTSSVGGVQQAGPVHAAPSPAPWLHAGMAFVPGGEYAMGDHHDNIPWALPVHKVYIDPFWIDVYEVTNKKYCAYLNSALVQGLIQVSGGVVYKYGSGEGYCDTTTSSSYSRITWNGSRFGVTTGKADHPMVMVSWYGAAAYANWRSAQERLTACYDLNTWSCNFSAEGYRLPTEAEWEKAARGGEYTPYYRYPWGDSIDGSKANYFGSGDAYETGPFPWTTPVGYYDGSQVPSGGNMANGYGLYDMAANGWEWCNDWFDPYYYSSSPYAYPTGPLTGSYRVIRGGSWSHTRPLHLRLAARGYKHPAYRYYGFGFRVLVVRH